MDRRYIDLEERARKERLIQAIRDSRRRESLRQARTFDSPYRSRFSDRPILRDRDTFSPEPRNRFDSRPVLHDRYDRPILRDRYGRPIRRDSIDRYRPYR